MKKLFLKIISIAVISLGIWFTFCYFICFKIPDVYSDSYQKGFLYQVKALEKADADTSKLVIIGGSYMTFGIDIEQMEEELGIPCYILGVHSGMGMQHVVETAEKFLNTGDILVYNLCALDGALWTKNDYGVALMYQSYSGQDGLTYAVEFAKEHPYLTFKSASDIACRKLKTFITNNIKSYFDSSDEEDTVYSSKAFDRTNGNLVYSRVGECMDDGNDVSSFYNAEIITNERISLMNSFFAKCHQKGVITYMTFNPVYVDGVADTETQIKEFQRKIEEEVDVTVISSPQEFFFEKEYFYNGRLHMNSRGAKIYTHLVSEDINKARREG